VRFNELVLRLIESPAHHLMPSGLNRIAYTGPVSGEAVRLPVHSVADGSRFLVVACRPEQKRWWRTFRCPQRARLTRAGRRYDVIGRVLTSQQRADALTLYTAASSAVPEVSTSIRRSSPSHGLREQKVVQACQPAKR
jgi:hypothetical protein